MYPQLMPVSAGSTVSYRSRVYMRMRVDDDESDPKVLIRPAACHVVPLARACLSSRRTSGTPSFARW